MQVLGISELGTSFMSPLVNKANSEGNLALIHSPLVVRGPPYSTYPHARDNYWSSQVSDFP